MPLRFARALLLLALLLTAVGIFVPFLPTFARDGLDESWMLGMNVALAQGLVPGRDIVFTLGPYAAIYTRNYHPGTDAGMLWGSLYLALSFAFLLHGLYRHTRWPLRVATLVVFAGLAYSRDALLLFLPLLAGAYTYRTAIQSHRTDSGERTLLASLALAYAPFGLLVMIKGSMLVACVFTQLLSTALFVALKQHRAALVILLAPVLSAFAWWTLAGLPVAALPDYFITIFPIIAGYGEAMATNGPLAEVILFVALSGALLAYLAMAEKARGPVALYLILLFAAAAFLAFKGGYIRHDNHVGHALLAACHLLLAALLACLLRPSRTALALLCASLLAWLGSSAFHALPRHNLALIPPTFVMTDHALLQRHLAAREWGAATRLTLAAGARHLVETTWSTYADAARGLALRLQAPHGLEAQHAQHMNALATQSGFPPFAGSTDIYSFRQTRLIASGNHWAPRPVFQSYTVYTPELAELNRRHLVADDAPDNILLRLEPIDRRLPALEDGPSWTALLSHYRPVAFVSGYLHLGKRARPEPAPMQSLGTRRHILGQRIEVPGTAARLFARIDVRPTLAGRLIGLLYKPSPLSITLELHNGDTRHYRFVAGMGRAGFVLSPFIGSAADFALLYAPSDALDGQRVRAITLDGDVRLWQTDFALELDALPSAGIATAPLPGLTLPQPIPANLPVHEATHCDGNLEQLNGLRAHSAQAVTGMLHASGWLARSAARGEPARGIQLILTAPSGERYRLRTQTDPRPDIAAYLGQPELAAGGFIVAADVRGLQGPYTLRIAHEDNGIVQHCAGPAIPLQFGRGITTGH